MADILPVGAEVAGYRIESVIGRGGMAVVYRAEDLRLGRKVALKLLAPELAQSEQFRARFIRESRLAASLDHPNIIPIYEAGETDGLLYIVMRFVVGSDLKDVLARDGPLEPERTVRLFMQIADALDAAHVHGLVHRDVKPGNILVASGQEYSDHVYLTDFGLTKRSTSLSGALTRTGHFLGTIDYVAPEQIAGKPVDAHTDIYALGCVLYECLTGQLPFHRDDDAALLWAHLVEMPPPVAALRPDLPPEVDAVVARAMAKAPEERYDSCRELVRELQDSLILTQSVRGSRWDTDSRRPGTSVATGEPLGEPGPVGETAAEHAAVSDQHPSFPPGQFDLRAGGSGTSGVDEGVARWDEEPEVAEAAPVSPPGRRPRWLLPVAVVAVLAVVLAGLGLFVRSRSSGLSQHFNANDRVPFSFDYPGDWRGAGTGVNVVFSPSAEQASRLFITKDWTGMVDVMRGNPEGAAGLNTVKSFTEIDTSSADSLQNGVKQLLPDSVTFTSAPRRATVGGVLSDELAGELADPSPTGAALKIWSYVVKIPRDGSTVVLTFFADPRTYESQRKTFDRILQTIDFGS